VAKLERKSLIGRPRLRWEYINKIDLREVEWNGMDWLDLSIGTGRGLL
jgi:hypothetical protein